jgi:DNA-binding SARP family transcriptional activator/DNA polymerase III delta prime subunit
MQFQADRTASVLEFEVLGELAVHGEAGPVDIAGSRRRALLLRLLVSANQAVPAELLIEDTWDQDPPPGAAKTLQSHLSFLRKALGPDRLSHSAGGYALSVGETELDSWLFEREYRNGRSALAAGDPDEAVRSLESGLARWRGQALADVNSASWALPEMARLDETRLAALEACNEALLGLGRHHDVVANAEAAVAENPLRERPWAQLMLALYRSGRQADALRAYQRLSAHLREELGIEPSTELVLLEEAMVLQKPDLDWTAPQKDEPAHPATTRPPTRLVERIPLPARLVPDPAAQFVGREGEQQLLENAWKQAAEGGPRLLLIGGEPGIGKTTLASALGASVFEQGAIVLYGRCDEDLGIPYQPWVEAIGHVVRCGPEELFENQVPTRMAELARLAPELAGRTGVGVSGTAADESERYLLFGAVVDLLSRCSQLAPTLLVLDDLHWADRPTIQLLRHLITAGSPSRLLIVGAYRDSDLGAGRPLAGALAEFHREPGVARLTLRGLGDIELLAMLESHIGGEMPEDVVPLRNALLEETGGNPFFVGEMLRHFQEIGAIAHSGKGQWKTTDNVAMSGLPVSVREVIGHRVGRLGGSAVPWLTMAAVIGRDFDIELLTNVVHVEQDDLLVILDAAVEARILVEGELPGRFSFAHALTAHALYDDLASLRRARAHRAVAEAIEDQCGEDLTTRVGELAYHWAHATQPQELDKALEYAERAGDRALQQLAPDEAARWYGQALDMLEHRGPADGRQRASLLVGLGDAQRQIGDPDHRATLLEAAHLANEAGDTITLVQAALANNRGFHSSSSSGDEERVAVLRIALEQLGKVDSPERAKLLATLSAESLHFVEFDECFDLAKSAVECARRAGDRTTLADVLVRSQEAISMPRTLELRVAWAEEACEIASTENHFLRWLAYGARAIGAHESADVTKMRESLQIYREEAERIGQPFCQWVNYIHQSWYHILLGDLAEAERLAELALNLGLASAQPDALFLYGIQIIDIRFCQDRVGELLPLMEQLAAETPGPSAFRALHCLAASESGDSALARELLDRDMATGLEINEGATWLTGQYAWAMAAIECGHDEAAQSLYDRLVPWHRQIATIAITAAVGCVARVLGMLAAHLEEFDRSDEWFSEALEIDQSMESPMHIAWTRACWARMLVQRDAPMDRAKAAELAESALRVAQDSVFPRVKSEALAVQQQLI